MKILLACEGQSEVYLINNLIDRGYLSFGNSLLLDEPLNLRQLDKIAPVINLLPIDEEVIIYRIGDTLKEPLDLSKFKTREQYIKVYKVCTKSELEILVIINENLYSEYQKCSKTLRPKAFVNLHIKNYEPKAYFETHDMMLTIKEYKRIKKHKKGEMYLADLLSKYSKF